MLGQMIKCKNKTKNDFIFESIKNEKYDLTKDRIGYHTIINFIKLEEDNYLWKLCFGRLSKNY